MPKRESNKKDTRYHGGRHPIHGRSGYTRDRAYDAWSNMRQRCYNPTRAKDFPRYGARGITVCDRWRWSFVNFLADMGDPPQGRYSLERKDNNLGYSPANCVWALKLVQANNTRTNRFLTYQGQTLTVAQWARKVGIDRNIIYARINRRHWTIERALSTPVH